MKRLYLTLLLFVLLSTALAQNRKKEVPYNAVRGKTQSNQFLDQQWWLGFKAGPTLAQASPRKRYTILTPVNYDASSVEKKYGRFKEIGIQTTVEITYYYKGFYFSAQPSYTSSLFIYTNQYQWQSSQGAAILLTQNYKQEQKIETADFPFFVKYDITGNTLRPFAQLGVFYALLLNATKTVNVSSIDLASGGTSSTSAEQLIVGAKDLFNNYWGIAGGIGMSYQPGNIRLTLEVNYRQSLTNVTNPLNRFSNDRLSGIGESQDDLNLKNVCINAGVLFPLRYISKSFKSNDRQK